MEDKKVLLKEVKNNLKRKKIVIKNKTKKVKVFEKVEGLSFNLTRFFVSIVSSYFKTITLSDKLNNYKKDNKTTILNNNNLTTEEKRQLLSYKNLSIINLKDINKDTKKELKEYCLNILKTSYKKDKNNKTILILEEEDKQELVKFIKNILNIDYNFTFAMLKNALLSGLENKMQMDK